MIDMSELTESVKGYIEGLQDVLQRKYQISEDKALNMITSSYIMDSLIDSQRRRYMMTLKHMQIIFMRIIKHQKKQKPNGYC